MNVLDYPLDAAAVNYLSFGFLTLVNNLWTWVAVLTAAISFWKIRVRASGSASVVSPEKASCSGRANPSDSSTNHLSSSVSQNRTDDEVVDEQRNPVPQYAAPLKVKIPVGRQVLDNDSVSVTKGKLTVYYYEDSPTGSCNDFMMTEDEEMEEQVDVGTGDAWWQSWETMLKSKTGDSWWYRYQDLTMVNGNVVRLWDCRCSGNCTNCIVW